MPSPRFPSPPCCVLPSLLATIPASSNPWAGPGILPGAARKAKPELPGRRVKPLPVRSDAGWGAGGEVTPGGSSPDSPSSPRVPVFCLRDRPARTPRGLVVLTASTSWVTPKALATQRSSPPAVPRTLQQPGGTRGRAGRNQLQRGRDRHALPGRGLNTSSLHKLPARAEGRSLDTLFGTVRTRQMGGALDPSLREGPNLRLRPGCRVWDTFSFQNLRAGRDPRAVLRPSIPGILAVGGGRAWILLRPALCRSDPPGPDPTAGETGPQGSDQLC